MGNSITEWILADINKIRKSGLLDISRKEIPNGDGTFFVPIHLAELSQYDCIVANQIK